MSNGACDLDFFFAPIVPIRETLVRLVQVKGDRSLSVLGVSIGICTAPQVAKFCGNSILVAFSAIETDYLFESFPLFGTIFQVVSCFPYVVERSFDRRALLLCATANVHSRGVEKAQRRSEERRVGKESGARRWREGVRT